MTYIPVPGDVVQIRGYYTNVEQAAEITNNWVVGAVAGGGLTQSQIAAKFDPFYAGLIPSMSSLSLYYGTSAQRIYPFGRVPMETSIASRGPGTAGAIDLPRQTRFIISWQTGATGRSHRGRIYLPFPSAVFNTTGGTPTAAYVAFAQTLANVLSQTQVLTVGAVSTTLNPVIYHRQSHTYDIILSNTLKSLWGTQRRSGSYGKANKPGF